VLWFSVWCKHDFTSEKKRKVPEKSGGQAPLRSAKRKHISRRRTFYGSSFSRAGLRKKNYELQLKVAVWYRQRRARCFFVAA
jgi:hypothetical protein